MQNKANAHLMPLEEAKMLISKMVNQTKPKLDRPLTLPLSKAIDHVLFQDIEAKLDVPSFDNSAMDGFAYAYSSGTQLKCIGQCLAGEIFPTIIKPQECIRIMTGAPIPDGADTVIMQEQTDCSENNIKLTTPAKEGANIRRKGSDIHIGQIILQKGKRLSPSDIGLLASLGVDEVDVYRPINVALFSTGDELRLPGKPLPKGCIYDSNRFAIEAILKRLGVNIINLGIIPDDPEKLSQAFQAAGEKAEIVISTGGVSVGDADYTKDILTELGDIAFWKLAIKPGKPLAFGRLSRLKTQHQPLFFGLPGNPVSAMVTFHQLALPCLQLLGGEAIPSTLAFNATAQTYLKKRPGRIDFQRAQLNTNDEGEIYAIQQGDQSSALLSSISHANAFVVLEQGRNDVNIGEKITVHPFDRWLI